MYKEPENKNQESVIPLTGVSLFDDRKNLFKVYGSNYLNELVEYLCNQHGFDYGFVGSYNEESEKMTTMSFYGRQERLENFSYELKNSVCNEVVGAELCVYLDRVQELFPKDEILNKYNSKTYVGYPLFDLSDQPVGIVALLNSEAKVNSDILLDDLELLRSKTEQELARVLLSKPLDTNYKEFTGFYENVNDVLFSVKYNKANEQVGMVLSPSSKKMFGYSEEEFELIQFKGLFLVPEEFELFIEMIKGGESLKSYPLTLKKKNGSNLYVQVDFECLSGNLSQDIAYSIRGIIKDVTKQYTENLRTEIAYVIARKSERRLTNIKSLVAFIRNILSEVVDVSSFYIALHDEEKKELYLPAFYDEESKDVDTEFRIPFENSITEYIIKSKKPLITTKDKIKDLIEAKKLEIRGVIPEGFVGIPLRSEGKCCGAMVMQSYKKNHVYSKEDTDLFQFVATQVAYVVERTLWQDILIKKEEHYRSLIENSSEIFGIINEKGIIEYVSESTKRITGFSPSDFIGKSFENFLIKGNFNGLIQDRKRYENQPEVLTILNKNGKSKNLEISVNRIKRKLIFNAKDVTSKLIAERKRDESLKQITDLRNALNYSASIYFIDYKTFKITDVNRKLTSLSGYKKKELIGQSPIVFNSKNDRVKNWDKTWERIKLGEVWQGEMSYQKKDGSIYWVYETIAPTMGSNGEFSQFINIQFDITKEKATKTTLIKEVIEAQERERERFAMEIHDGLGQVLLAAKMNLNALNDYSDGLEVESKKILNNSIDLLGEAVQEARTISHGLMSRVLNRFGLAYAIDEIVSNINSNKKIFFEFKHNIKEERFEEELEMGIYRTLQELIKNIIRHSKADQAFLEILKEENVLSIEIVDNGVGIDKKTVENPKSGGIGLRNMKSRIEYLGGTFEIEEMQNPGTKIKILITF